MSHEGQNPTEPNTSSPLPQHPGQGDLVDVFERPFDGDDDPRLQVARVLTRAEAEAVLEHRGDLVEALSQPRDVPDGWCLAPLEPTREMITASRYGKGGGRQNVPGYLDGFEIRELYRAALSARPTPGVSK